MVERSGGLPDISRSFQDSDGVGDLKAFLEDKKQTSRDNGQTPFQWNAEINAGFTTGKPWLKVNPDYTAINAEAQEKDSNSVLHYFRNLVQLRKNNPVLVYGKYSLVDKDNPDIYAYTREMGGTKFLVVLNFHNTTAKLNAGIDLQKAKILIHNYYEKPAGDGNFKPYEAVIYAL